MLSSREEAEDYMEFLNWLCNKQSLLTNPHEVPLGVSSWKGKCLIHSKSQAQELQGSVSKILSHPMSWSFSLLQGQCPAATAQARQEI